MRIWWTSTNSEREEIDFLFCDCNNRFYKLDQTTNSLNCFTRIAELLKMNTAEQEGRDLK